jgi:hypothetical protein
VGDAYNELEEGTGGAWFGVFSTNTQG